MQQQNRLVLVLFLLFWASGLRAEWINGLTIEAPRQPYAAGAFAEAATSLQTNWVAIVPYGFIYSGTAEVQFNIKRQWWGETREGAEVQIRSAKEQGQKVLLKPQVWLMGGAYTGDLDFKTEKEWLIFERSYRAYLLHYLESESCRSVDALCIGTEWETSVKKRPQFWRQLIRDIREIYSGPITYAANWDAYREPRFWKSLDAIGVNAYFPLKRGGWLKWKNEMKSFSRKTGKPVVFTEFGYRSVDQTREQPWEEAKGRSANPQEQQQALEQLFQTFWNREESSWFHGGFLWKWHLIPGRKMSHGYTVQGKLAESLVAETYRQMMPSALKSNK